MKKLFMVLAFLTLLCVSLSARYIFDGKIIFSKHATNKDSLAYLIIEKAGGVLDTFATIDTSGTVTLHYSFLELFFEGNLWLLGDTLFFTDGGADTSSIMQQGTYFKFNSDNSIMLGANVIMQYNLQCQDNFDGSYEAKSIRWDGHSWYIDYDDDNALAYIYFHGTDQEHLLADSAGQVLSWTGVGGFEAPKLQSGFFFQELWQDASANKSTASGSSTSFYGGLSTFSSDSLVFDSLRILWKTNQNDVYIDSVYIVKGYGRDGYLSALLMGNGTNIGAGDIDYHGTTYTVNATISYDWRLQIGFYVETSATAGTGYLFNAKGYFHY